MTAIAEMQMQLERAAHEAAKLKLQKRLQRMREENQSADPAPAKPAMEAFDEWDDWVLRLRPLRSHSAPPTARIRKLLKTALRTCGFRAEEIRQVKKNGSQKEAG